MSAQRFNTDEPIAIFITWTCYGTWLPGDERGSCRWGEGELNSANPLFEEMAVSNLKEPPFEMSTEDRQTVEQTICRHSEIRNWTLHAVNARSNHVHVVVTATGCDPRNVHDQFKAWCTRSLKKNYPSRKRFWTEGGSCRSVNQEEELDSVVVYVRDAQDRKGRDVEKTRARSASE